MRPPRGRGSPHWCDRAARLPRCDTERGMTERWKQYIEGGVAQAGTPARFAVEQWMFLFPLYLAIRKALPDGGRLIDIGCGAGAFTSLLTMYGYGAVGVDQDADVVAHAHQVGQTLGGRATF